MNPKNTPEKFWSRVLRVRDNDCWLWCGATTGRYGWVSWAGKGISSHRKAWELTRGPIPRGKHVLHQCDQTLCCRPSHLYLGGHKENMHDMKIRGRANRPTGERNPSAKLTERDVLDILGMYGGGDATFASLGALFGVQSSTISNIITRKSWAHLELLEGDERGETADERVQREMEEDADQPDPYGGL